MEPSEAFDKLKFEHLSQMLYRDTVRQKHLKQDRLAKELTDKARKEETSKLELTQALEAGLNQVDPVAEIIIEHMLAATSR